MSIVGPVVSTVSKPASLKLLDQIGGGGSVGPSGPPELVPDIDFNTWVVVYESPMESVTTDSFTNSGTGYIQLNIGAVAGKEYDININQVRGAGTLRMYLAAERGIDIPEDVISLEGGKETVRLLAHGPWLTFRASVGNTTTTVTELSVKEYVPGLDTGDEEVFVDMVTSKDFSQWYNVASSPMTAVGETTFTNGGTGYLQYDIGAEAGKAYTIKINQSRGAGTLRMYLAPEQGLSQSSDQITLQNGYQELTFIADGSWLTFRASVGGTTTTVEQIEVYPATRAEKQALMLDRLRNAAELQGIYVMEPVVQSQQVLMQNAAGTLVVEEDGDLISLVRDLSSNAYELKQENSSRAPMYSTESPHARFDGVDDALLVPAAGAEAAVAVAKESGVVISYPVDLTGGYTIDSDVNGVVIMDREFTDVELATIEEYFS